MVQGDKWGSIRARWFLFANPPIKSKRVNTNEARANNEQIRYFVILGEPRATRVAGTSFLSIVTIIVIACDLYRNASLSLHFCLVPFSTIYTIVSTQIATDITRDARPPSIEKTEKSRNCYRDALFDVEPRKSRPKTRKREKKRNRLLRSFHLLVLGHRYPWRNFISAPSLSLFLPSSFHTLCNPPRLSR